MKEGRTENRRWRKKRWGGSERKGKIRCGEVGGAREDDRKRRWKREERREEGEKLREGKEKKGKEGKMQGCKDAKRR